MPGPTHKGFGWFRKQPALADIVQESQKNIGGSIQCMEKEIAGLKGEEDELLTNLKVAAQNGNESSMRVLAKCLVRLRSRLDKLQGNVALLQAVRANVRVAAATEWVSTNLEQATRAMDAIQQRTDAAKINATIDRFTKANEHLEVMGTVMDRTMDDALDDGGMEESTQALVNQVLDAVNMDLSAALGAAPRRPAHITTAAGASSSAPAAAAANREADEVEEVIARMQQLRS